MGLDGALDFTLQLTDASSELMVQLPLCEQFLLPSRERLLGECEFFRELSDYGLRVASE